MFGPNGLINYNDGYHGTLFYAFDERGNTAQRTNTSGTLVSTDSYDAYGQRLSGGAYVDAYGFGGQAGYRTDAETGLLLLTHRYYDPAQGRFVTRDPIGYDGGINLYSYTQNNPGNGSDPSGMDAGWANGPYGSGGFWGEPPVSTKPAHCGDPEDHIMLGFLNIRKGLIFLTISPQHRHKKYCWGLE